MEVFVGEFLDFDGVGMRIACGDGGVDFAGGNPLELMRESDELSVAGERGREM